MGPLDAIKICLAKSFQFTGRASRSEFWWFGPVYFVALALGILTEVIPSFLTMIAFFSVSPLFFLWLALLLPRCAAMSRRLQDIGLSPMWMLLLPAYLLVSIPLALAVDAANAWGAHHPTRGLPEFAWMFVGLNTLIASGFVIALMPSDAKFRSNPNEVPS